MVENCNKREVVVPFWADYVSDRAEWRTLREVCSDVVDCSHSTPVLQENGPCLLARTPDVVTGTFRREAAQRVSWEVYAERTSSAAPEHGDLLYSREGTYFGMAAEVPDGGAPICLGQRMVLLRPDHDVISPRYLRLYLNSPLMQSHIRGFQDGSVAQRLNVSTIRGLPVAVLPQADQEAIAEIVGSLDDKIDLNREMNRTLEAAAQAIFRSWFVDFDPVAAKIDGRRPFGMDAETAALFPDRFVDSDLGPMPEGWEIGGLGGMYELAYGKSLPKKVRVQGAHPVYGSGGVDGTHEIPLVEGPGVIVGRKGTVGSVHWCDSDFFPIDTTFYVVKRQGAPGFLWAYHLLKNLGLDRMNSDSAVPGLSRSTAYAQPCVQPPKPVAVAFEVLAERLFELRYHNESESQTLAELRDLLLPKLLSGEIQVPEAEEVVEDVA
jgi:type I restriction enzyme S subunit